MQSTQHLWTHNFCVSGSLCVSGTLVCSPPLSRSSALSEASLTGQNQSLPSACQQARHGHQGSVDCPASCRSFRGLPWDTGTQPLNPWSLLLPRVIERGTVVA